MIAELFRIRNNTLVPYTEQPGCSVQYGTAGLSRKIFSKLFRKKNVVLPYFAEQPGCSVQYFLRNNTAVPYTEQVSRSVFYGTARLFRMRVRGGSVQIQ